MSEQINIHLSVNGKNALGCQRHDKHIMISYYDRGQQDFVDLFMNQLEAKNFLKDLQQCIEENDDETIAPAKRHMLIEKTNYKMRWS